MNITVVIVESHQHVLEHIHEILRKKKLLNKEWSLIHFDAHPDMACTRNAPAIACFTPRHYYSLGNDGEKGEDERNATNLYELLDSTSSGIAEWILPLALAANLNRIEWIKPTFSQQMSEGKYQFAVGAECRRDDDAEEITSFLDLPKDSQVKVDLRHPYYMDDNSVVSCDKLALKKNIELQVSELPIDNTKHRSELHNCISNTDNAEQSSWILDICLDYFVCLNPYIHDLEKINQSATRAFLDVMKRSKLNVTIDNNQPISSEYQDDIFRFYELLQQLLLDHCENENNSNKKDGKMHATDATPNSGIIFEPISIFFETLEEAEEYISRLIQEINNDSQVLSMIIEAIPNWSMPHDVSSSTTERMSESLLLAEDFLNRRMDKINDEPFLITIARSSLDGFCPPPVVDFLQDQILDMIHRIVCGTCKCKSEKSSLHNGCRLQIVRDYGQWEGSTIP